LPARVFFRASDFKVRTSSVVHDRRFGLHPVPETPR
jgi:hypothetical protein